MFPPLKLGIVNQAANTITDGTYGYTLQHVTDTLRAIELRRSTSARYEVGENFQKRPRAVVRGKLLDVVRELRVVRKPSMTVTDANGKEEKVYAACDCDGDFEIVLSKEGRELLRVMLFHTGEHVITSGRNRSRYDLRQPAGRELYERIDMQFQKANKS